MDLLVTGGADVADRLHAAVTSDAVAAVEFRVDVVVTEETGLFRLAEVHLVAVGFSR